MSTDLKTVVTRYAPSPTGFQHIGGIRTAIFAYLFARQNKGTFILRIEDTDKSREVEGAINHTMDALTWLGLEWDYGPDKKGEFGSCLQSDRLEIYKAYALKLVEQGLAYPDPYTEEQLNAFRNAAKEENRPFLFKDHRPETFAAWDGNTPLRFKVPEIKRYHWHDEVRGELEAGEEMLDDFILIKGDGYPTYNFAHIVDDAQMGVTHIMRGEEFISSMPKFLSLYDALKIPYPKFVTMPPIMGPDGKKKLSKRDGAKDILDYKSEGYLPEAMVNFLALIGWNPGGEQELFSRDELIERFSLKDIQRSGGTFNEEKLRWMNQEYLRDKDDDFKLTYAKAALPESLTKLATYSDKKLLKLLPTIFERIHNQTEITEAATAGEYDFAFLAPEVELEMLKWKNDNSHIDALPRLIHVTELLKGVEFDSPEAVKEALWPYAEEVGRGEVLWPLRVTLTGRERSPDPFTCAYVVGKEETLMRLSAVIERLTSKGE